MSPQQYPGCPRTEQLSALVDEALETRSRDEIASHAATCPLCGAMLRDLAEQRATLRLLAEEQPGVDLVRLVDRRLGPRRSARPPLAQGKWWQRWQLVPSGLAGAGALAAGLYFGVVLTGGAGIAATQVAGMEAFDPVPPGGICVGFQSCYARGR